jgi:2-(1,2-epoxy-1,2-dihydrophenyl)acetyl-CoA isomerase
MSSLVHTEIRHGGGAACFCITLAAPRSNALEPGLLSALLGALEELERSGEQRALLSGGSNFSTGGDVLRFFEAASQNRAEAYADEIVPVLQSCIERMIAMPVLFATAARGAITGGSAGFLFASDIAVLAPDAFLQPYYAKVGFAPDGGWTAILPERIGTGAAARWLLCDERLSVGDLLDQGLATAVDSEPEARAMDLIGALDLDAALAAKALIWDSGRRAHVKQRLAAETVAFRSLVGRKSTRAKMARFLGKMEMRADV